MNPQFGRHQKIVIVEDNYPLADIYKTRMEMLGYTVFVAYDGIQALQVIEDQVPDLVLLDLMVPKKAGDQILEEMRDSDWGKDIKVVVISNLNESEAPAGLRNLGIEGYAVKANLSNDQLDQLVDAILKPMQQAEDVVLGHENTPELRPAAPRYSAPPVQVADPYSGTRLQGQVSVPMPHAVTQPAPQQLQQPQPVPAPTSQYLPPQPPTAATYASQMHVPPARTKVVTRHLLNNAPQQAPNQYVNAPVSDMQVVQQPIHPRPLTLPSATAAPPIQPATSAPELISEAQIPLRQQLHANTVHLPIQPSAGAPNDIAL